MACRLEVSTLNLTFVQNDPTGVILRCLACPLCRGTLERSFSLDFSVTRARCSLLEQFNIMWSDRCNLAYQHIFCNAACGSESSLRQVQQKWIPPVVTYLTQSAPIANQHIYILYVCVYVYIYAHKYHFQTCFRFALPFNTGPSWPGYSPALRPLRSSVQGNHERQLGWQRPWDLGHPSGYLTLENRWTSPIFLRIFYGNLPGMVGSRKKKWDKPSISPWNGDFSQLSKLHGWARPR